MPKLLVCLILFLVLTGMAVKGLYEAESCTIRVILRSQVSHCTFFSDMTQKNSDSHKNGNQDSERQTNDFLTEA